MGEQTSLLSGPRPHEVATNMEWGHLSSLISGAEKTFASLSIHQKVDRRTANLERCLLACIFLDSSDIERGYSADVGTSVSIGASVRTPQHRLRWSQDRGQWSSVGVQLVSQSGPVQDILLHY